jgi:hypothetical protein
MTARYADSAVSSLATYLAVQLPLQLRAVEVELQLANGSLGSPVDVVTARVPNDMRSPLVKVYDAGGDMVSHRVPRMMAIDCAVEVSLVGDCNVEALEVKMRRWLTAVYKSLEQSRTLGGLVEQALAKDYGSGLVRGADTATRFVSSIGVEVKVHDQ